MSESWWLHRLKPGATICRAFTRDISTNVLYCWGATCWIVCFGAPLGSLLLTPGLRAQLRIAFYILAIAQFVGFAVLRIKDDLTSWLIYAASTALVLLLLCLHYLLGRRKLRRKGDVPEELSLFVVKDRLLHK